MRHSSIAVTSTRGAGSFQQLTPRASSESFCTSCDTSNLLRARDRIRGAAAMAAGVIPLIGLS
jgi:hypothetical protein